MKKIIIQLLVITISLWFSISLNAQTNFFKYDNINKYSYISDVQANSNFYFVSGGVYNFQTAPNQLYYHPYLYKLDSYGNIIKSYSTASDSSFVLDPLVEILNDTIYYFYTLAHEVNNGFINELKICKFDKQLNLHSSKSYFYTDSTFYLTSSVRLDEDDNFLLTGTRLGISHGNYGYLMKINKYGDTLNNNFNVSWMLRPLDLPEKNKYLCARNNNYLLFYDRDLNQVGQISVMDTFFSSYTSLAKIGYDSIVMIGYKTEVNYLDHKQNMLFKTIDYQGNTINFYQINTPDTINRPAYNSAVSIDKDFLYFSWNKHIISNSDTPPSRIGVGKFNKSLTPEWIKFFGKPNTYYSVSKIITSIDGGCLVVGAYLKTSYTNYNARYFILKVNSQGLATFFKHTDIIVEPKLIVYPNPAKDIISVNLIDANQLIKDIKIFDLQGKEVLKLQSNSAQQKIDISNLPSGVYLIKGKTNLGQDFSRKFVKQ